MEHETHFNAICFLDLRPTRTNSFAFWSSERSWVNGKPSTAARGLLKQTFGAKIFFGAAVSNIYSTVCSSYLVENSVGCDKSAGAAAVDWMKHPVCVWFLTSSEFRYQHASDELTVTSGIWSHFPREKKQMLAPSSCLELGDAPVVVCKSEASIRTSTADVSPCLAVGSAMSGPDVYRNSRFQRSQSLHQSFWQILLCQSWDMLRCWSVNVWSLICIVRTPCIWAEHFRRRSPASPHHVGRPGPAAKNSGNP